VLGDADGKKESSYLPFVAQSGYEDIFLGRLFLFVSVIPLSKL